ncbi:hypothetical protein [Paenibacillus mucilaginosus]|uniref:DUF4367 domain-containing protein n=1 Tax=Paenibacillus mucilaginosus (strain KNP414) TaxID=1036673 RepID=F8F545_PAEMK|nr:hypothetical protein [Paenibacillus mucilaginosus]AEI40775.1 hypothetical protein KNP414_02214 [Paenibacillus mucilaginosus KNP414]MCG7211748.1 hypothetical protein [Paenibacillus mucilaginosus]WDM29899.1 hypothetical protein KCX80_12450 [Paenibacillus mucilaginosus]
MKLFSIILIVWIVAGCSGAEASKESAGQENALPTPTQQPKPVNLQPEEERKKEAVRSFGYVVMDGYYYRVTGETVDDAVIGKVIGEIKRVGDWEIKRSGDSNEYPPGPLYSIQEKDTKEVIAYRLPKKKGDPGPYRYSVLERSEQVEQHDPKQIMGAKNDPEEVGIALQNIRKAVPYLYEFDSNLKSAVVNQAGYSSNTGVTLYYRVSEADDKEIQGFLFIFEYPQEKAALIMNSAFSANIGGEPRSPAKASETFEMNGIQWSYYGTHLLRGEKDGHYYELQTQGKFTRDRLVGLLKHFNNNEQ